MMWKKYLCALVLSVVASVFGSDCNEFESNQFLGIHREYGPENKLTAITEPDGNKCLKFEIMGFKTVENDKRMIHGSIYLGRFDTKPGEIYHYSVSVKGSIPFVFLSALEWSGKEFYKDLAFTKDLKYRKIPVSSEWKEYTGTFTAGANAQKITLALMVYEDERYTPKFHYTPGDYVLLDKVRISGPDGRNLFTHLSFVPASPTAKFEKKSEDYVVLFKGNSITRHFANDWTREKLGWDHVSGMAASSEEKDFAHVLCDKLQKAMPDRKIRPVFGKGNKDVLSDLDEVRSWKPDLIVLQGGEHAVTPTEVTQYEKYLDEALGGLKTCAPAVICVGVWETGRYEGNLAGKVQNIQQKVSAKHHVPFVSVETLANDPACRGWGTSGGVKWHPNDKGMAGYADVIFDAWKQLPR